MVLQRSTSIPSPFTAQSSIRDDLRVQLKNNIPKSQDGLSLKKSRGKLLFSLFAVLQIATLLLSLLSNYAPSYLEGEILGWLSPYIVTTHQFYGAKPLEMTHSESVDFPVQIDAQFQGDRNWTTITFGRDSLNQTRWPMLARIMVVVTEDDDENPILAEVTAAIVKQINSTRRKNVRRIRLMQPHVLSFDEDSYVQSGQEDLLDGLDEGNQIFAADVVYDQDSKFVGVLPILSKYRTSPAANLP